MLPAPPQRVTVLHAGQSWSWASWMAHRLKLAGTRPVPVRWDPVHTVPEPEALDQLLAPPGKVLLLVDDWFLRFDDTRRQAWADVLDQIMPREGHRLVAVSVTAAALPDAADSLGHVLPLRGYDAERAAAALLTALELTPGRHGPVTLERTRGPRFPEDRLEIDNAPRRNRAFTGRERILEQVHQAFEDGGEGARVALLGPAGIGKTQSAAEYVHRYKGEYDIVWWVHASVRATAREEFARLADKLGAEPGTGPVLRGRIEAAKRALGERVRWLVVLDGAEDPEDVDAILPEGPGHLLVTTQRTDWSLWCPEVVELPPFDRAESVDLACRRSSRLTQERAGRLAAVVEDYPLLIDQTAAWLRLNRTADIDAYILRLRDGDPHAVPVAPSDDYRREFQIAWAQTVNTLREKHPNAYELLALFVFFSPDVVPVGLVQSARAVDMPGHLVTFVTEPSSWNPVLRELSEATSMSLEYAQGPMDTQTVGALRMHRLFHRFVRGHLSTEEAREASRTACRVLVAADPRHPRDPIHWARYAEVIPHLEPTGALGSEDPDVRSLVLNCIEYLRVRGEYKEGQRLSQSALDSWTPTFGESNPQVLIAAHQLANMERRLGHYHEAERIGRELLRRVAGVPVSGTIQMVRAKNGLGGTLVALGRYDEARALYEEAEAQAVAELGGDEVPRTLAIRGNRAIALRMLGRYEESLGLHRAVGEAYLNLHGEWDQTTLDSGLRTSWALRLLGRYGEALDIQTLNLRQHQQGLGRDHDQTLVAQHNLALCLRRDGSQPRARTMMWEARERMVRRHGPDHPEALMMTTDYAMLLRGLGECDAAHDLVEDAAVRYGKLLGDDHPYTAGVVDDCALVQRDLGDAEGALRRTEEAGARLERALGPDHLWTVGCAMNTASALARTGALERAVALGREALARAHAVVGDSHVLTLNLAAGLAQDLDAAGEPEDADRARQEAVQRLSDNLSDDHWQVRYMREQHRPYWDFEPQLM
ncbi:FxSxx-COOH system tetratricopeptide repeat protein [Streptomyces sp. NPDC050997]|uniref:FxSxx-COOH system tetratricopeptide repeat protein n=1 Tax=Streptomyces sp. NPDC050997 TaxID=3155519 RepID=UPI0034409A44